MSSDIKNIYQRINSVMREVTYVQKDANVQGYKAVTHDKVTSALRASMVRHGIAIRLEQKESEIIEHRNPEKGIKMHLYSGVYNVHFVNIDSPDDVSTVSIAAHAADNGDKAPGKCASYATKSAMLKMFSLETGENDESRAGESGQYSDLQKDEFDEIIESNDGLRMLNFSMTTGDEIMQSLNDSFEKGKISKGKADVKRLTAEGHQKIDEIAYEISELIKNDDPAVSELTGELTSIEKRLVSIRLSPNEIQYLQSKK